MELFELAKLPFGYENQDQLDAALEKIPMERIYAAAEADPDESTSGYGFEDRMVIELLKWFKEWFQWVNNAPCEHCKSTKTAMVGVATGTPQEQRHGGRQVEVYKCGDCDHLTRFPRYNDPAKLLETRQGRCGEWANVFMLLLRALGLPTRYVWNSEDHVWNEVFSQHQNRWIHVDSCEAAFDKPLTYSDGWGKKMAYVIGFSIYGAKDITKRYVRRDEMQLSRDRFPEAQLEAMLATIGADCREGLDPEDQVLWYERDEIEQAELISLGQQPSDTTGAELPRQSGSKEWVEQRGEGGS